MRTALLLVGVSLLASIGHAQTPIPTEKPGVDTPGAGWIAAAPGNFAPANRPTDEAIDRIVIHDIEGDAGAGIAIFQRAGAKVSAHYIVGGDGQITQMVRERDVAYHAGNSPINHRAVGIECAGFAYRPGFYNPVELESVAHLVREISTRYGILRDREHIIGHAEVPNPRDPARFGGISGHTDPGPYWNWNTFMAMVRNDARLESAELPATIRPGEVVRAAVTLRNRGDDPWPANLAPDPRDGLKASGPVVYLGTANGSASSLSSLESWVSPSLAAGAATDTAPGSSARFEFSLRGPQQLGELKETLRLSTQPTAAQAQLPAFFGEAIPVSLRVVPWNIAMTPTAQLPDPNSVPDARIPARWSAQLPVGGWWALSITPPRAPRKRAKRGFRYTIGGAAREFVAAINGKDANRGARFAGFYRWPATPVGGSRVEVALESPPVGANLSAGEVHWIGPFGSPSAAAPTVDIQGFDASARVRAP